MQNTLTVLGVGSSAGTPVVGCKCSTCLSKNPKNNRTRCSSLVTLKNGKNILIDTSPDLREQSLRESIICIDAVLFTHAHADQARPPPQAASSHAHKPDGSSRPPSYRHRQA